MARDGRIHPAYAPTAKLGAETPQRVSGMARASYRPFDDSVLWWLRVDVRERTRRAGRDPPKNALRGVGVDGGGRGVAVDDCRGGGSRPSGIMTKRESTRRKTPRISQLAACWLLLSSYCSVPSSCLVAVFVAVPA